MDEKIAQAFLDELGKMSAFDIKRTAVKSGKPFNTATKAVLGGPKPAKPTPITDALHRRMAPEIAEARMKFGPQTFRDPGQMKARQIQMPPK
jgi:hypothetical protein